MSNDYNNRKFKELLDKLQQESWQLELIISGFAIFGLVSAYNPIKIAIVQTRNNDQLYYTVLLTIAFIACSILIFNLLIHVVLRGLWIGSLGLRYISGDIDFETLNYHPRFTKYLKKRIVSFDKYVATLENYCSVLFAISFLLIFYVLSFFLIIGSLLVCINLIIQNESFPETLRTFIGISLILFILLGAFLTFIDFITQGFLKKKKWLSKFYFPFYWVFSFITLSFLYRPLVYNFLDNKFGKRLSFILVPVYIGIFAFTTITYKNSNYFEYIQQSATVHLAQSKYESELLNERDFIKNASIQSKVITDPYIKFFKIFSEKVENKVYQYNPSLKPKEDKRGFRSSMKLTFTRTRKLSSKAKDSLAKKYLNTFNIMHSVYIDNVKYNTQFLTGANKQKQLGFETYISTKNLSEGKHMLQLKRLKIKKQDTVEVTDVTIPFWYFKQ